MFTSSDVNNGSGGPQDGVGQNFIGVVIFEQDSMGIQ